MSMFGSMFSAVSGLQAQGTAMSAISDNISNLKTDGYKTTEIRMRTQVTGSAIKNSYSPGGVRAVKVQLIDEQGLIQPTGSPTDLAIAGNGFFVTNRTTKGGEFGYTRAGSFMKDDKGYLYNQGGVYLYGWPTDIKGKPTVKNEFVLEELVPIQINPVNGLSKETKNVKLQGVLNEKWDSTVPVAVAQADTQLKVVQRVYDSLGEPRDIQFQFTRVDPATTTPINSLEWDLEISVPGGTCTRDAAPPNGAMANIPYSGAGSTPMRIVYDNTGKISTFDGAAVGQSTPRLVINWAASPAAPMDMAYDIGQSGVGGTGPVAGFTSVYVPGSSECTLHEQDGLRFGRFEGVSVDEDGIMSAQYDNGQDVPIFKLPIATFPNPNGLNPKSGNFFLQTQDSGEFTLGHAKTPGNGVVIAAALEGSRTDLGTEFTKMIIAQKAFAANTTVMKTANQMSDDLQNVVR